MSTMDTNTIMDKQYHNNTVVEIIEDCHQSPSSQSEPFLIFDGVHSTQVLNSTRERLQKSMEIEVLYNANQHDAIELKALLTSWNVSVPFDYFQNQQLFVGVLKRFPDQLTPKIFKCTNFSLGIQGEFIYNWSQWKASQQAPQPTQVTASQSVDLAPNNTLSEYYLNKTVPECMASSPKAKNSKEINLHNILLNELTPYDEVIINYHKKHGQLDEKTRKLLVDVFLQFCISNNILHVSKDQCKKLAEEIVKTFPGEAMGYYYVSRPGAPLGKLYSKFHNWKSNKIVKPAKSSEEAKPKTSLIQYDVKENELENIRSLKFDNLSVDERLNRWKSCVATRLNSLSANEKPIAEAWPQYKEPIGYKMLESDFNFVYGVKNKFLDEITDFMDLMLSHVLPRKLKISEDIQLLNQVIENKDQLHRNAICAAVFYLIQSLLPNGKDIRVLTDGSNTEPKRKRLQKNFTIKEARDAFISVCSTAALYKEHFDLKVKKESSVPPYITIIGSLLAPTDIYVDFENIRYKMVSLPRAIDICFKAYHLFQMEYSPAARLIWQFINMEFYGLKDVSAMPAVHVLVKNIQDASKQKADESTKL